MKNIVLSVIGLIVFILLVATCCYKPGNRELARDTITECAHQWSKWSAPEIKSNWFNGTWSYQSRTCEKCGLAEIKRVEIAPGGI